MTAPERLLGLDQSRVESRSQSRRGWRRSCTWASWGPEGGRGSGEPGWGTKKDRELQIWHKRNKEKYIGEAKNLTDRVDSVEMREVRIQLFKAEQEDDDGGSWWPVIKSLERRQGLAGSEVQWRTWYLQEREKKILNQSSKLVTFISQCGSGQQNTGSYMICSVKPVFLQTFVPGEC